MCADPNAPARAAARREHQTKVYQHKLNALKYWNKETDYQREVSAIRSLGESRAQSNIRVALEKQRGATLASKEKINIKLAGSKARLSALDAGDNKSKGYASRSRLAGKKAYLDILNEQARVDKKMYDLAGRGEATYQEGLKRQRFQKEYDAKRRLGLPKEFGAPVMDPGVDRQGQILSALSTGLSIASLFVGSDIRLKENIEEVGVSPKGYKIYEFNYINKPTRYRGAMAQDVVKINPMAVDIMDNGYLGVYYNKIDVNMEVVS